MTVIALSGRRIDAEDAKVARFPLARVDAVRQKLRRLFERLHADAIVASGACGADLLALEVAGEQQMARQMVLPFARERFKTISVTDRPGDWGAIFEDITKIMRQDKTRKMLKVLPGSKDQTRDFARTNGWILKQAQAQAAAQTVAAHSDPSVVAVVVWDGQSRGPDDMTAAFADDARQRNIPVYEVLTNR